MKKRTIWLTGLLLLALLLSAVKQSTLAGISEGDSDWTLMNSGTSRGLSWIWGSDSDNAFAVGESGTILNYDGSNWSTMSSGSTVWLRGIWGSGDQDIFAVGGDIESGGGIRGTILHYDGNGWTEMHSGTFLYGVWGSGSNDVFAAGPDGVLHYDGHSWQGMSGCVGPSLMGVWGSGSDDVFAVGPSGLILHYNGNSWSEMSSGTSTTLDGIWGTGPNDVYSVGGSGTVLHYDGNGWSEMNSNTTQMLRSIWGSGPDDIYAVGYYGTIIHYDGDNWSAVESGTDISLYGVGGNNDGDVFAAGNSGTILHHSGEAISDPNLTYIGSSQLSGRALFFQGEIDRRITLGDHVHLQLPFRNTGNATLSGAVVTVTGELPTFGSVGLKIHNGSSWGSYEQPITLTPSTLAPGQTGIADFWIYVTNPDPDVMQSMPTGTWMNLSTENEDWTISILLEPVEFEIEEHRYMLAGSCLHHPNDPQIQRYAQYAAGVSEESPSPTNTGDPDSAEQAISNLIERVSNEFDYVDTQNSRIEDTVLLAYTRDQEIGECRHFADLTIGLLRSLGLPSRYAGAYFEEGGHAWTEVYVGNACPNAWSPVDATWASASGYEPFVPDIYEAALGRFLRGSADLFPLSNAQSVRIVPFLCTPACYEDIDCATCKYGQFSFDTSCVESIEPCYHDYPSAASVRATNESEILAIDVDAPTFVTRTLPFSTPVTITNTSLSAIDAVTVTISAFREFSSTMPLYDLDIPERVITDLSAGGSVSLTWIVTPVVSGTDIPLQVIAFSKDSAVGYAELQLVNEPNSLPPLTLTGICGSSVISAGQSITLTASVLDEARQIITSTNTLITATIYSSPTLGFSATVNLPYCGECGQYQQIIDLPYEAPLGRYLIKYSASYPDYAPAEAETTFFVTPHLTVTLSVVPPILSSTETMTLRAQVYNRGINVTQAGVYAEIIPPGGIAKIPLFGDGGVVYSATLRPVDLTDSLDAPLLPGEWSVQAVANYQGSSAAATQTVTIRHNIYLPLVLRQ